MLIFFRTHGLCSLFGLSGGYQLIQEERTSWIGSAPTRGATIVNNKHIASDRGATVPVNMNDYLGEVEGENGMTVLAVESLGESSEAGERRSPEKKEDEILKEIQAEAYWSLQRTDGSSEPWGQKGMCWSEEKSTWQRESILWIREEKEAGQTTWPREERKEEQTKW